MPIHDHSAMLRHGLVVMNAAETGDSIDLGSSGLDDLMVWMLIPVDPTGTLTLTIEESADDTTFTTTSSPGAVEITATGYYTRKLYAPLRYLRFSGNAAASWGLVQIGVCQGEMELG